MPTVRRPLAEALEDRRLWAATLPQTFGGGGFDNVERVIETRTGDKIVTGLFSGSVDFDPAARRAAVLTARGDTDIYVASYTADGTYNWVIQIGGDYRSKEMRDFDKRDIQINQARFARYVGRVGDQPRLAGEYVNDIARDDQGNIFLAGSFRGSILAGGTALTADQTFTESYFDALVVKISATGGISWAERFGGAFDDDAMTVGVDRTNSPTIGGYYSRQADFDPSGKQQILETDGRDAGFVLRLNADGDFGWAYQFDSDSVGTDERNAVNDIAVTRAGDVFFAGSFAADADFLPGRREEFVLESEGKTDSVVGRLNRRGAFVWAQSTGSEDYEANSQIALDASGNVYTAGYFSEEMDVNPRPDVTTVFTPEMGEDDNSPEFSDLLVSKFAPDGLPLWQSQLGSEYIETVADLSVAADGAIYLSGSYFNLMDLAPGKSRFIVDSVRVNTDSIKDKNTRFGRNESYDWFVAKLSPNGKFVAGRSLGRADDDYAGGLTTFADGSVAVYGRIVDSDIPDRDDRQEQAWIYEMSPNLKLL